jgi:hypothetical protein
VTTRSSQGIATARQSMQPRFLGLDDSPDIAAAVNLINLSWTPPFSLAFLTAFFFPAAPPRLPPIGTWVLRLRPEATASSISVYCPGLLRAEETMEAMGTLLNRHHAHAVTPTGHGVPPWAEPPNCGAVRPCPRNTGTGLVSRESARRRRRPRSRKWKMLNVHYWIRGLCDDASLSIMLAR